MAVGFHNLFCSGSEDLDDEDFLSVLEGTESKLSVHEPTTDQFRSISKITTKNLEEAGNYSHDTKPLSVQEATSAPSLVQDVDDEELLSAFSELESEISEEQCQAPEPQLLLRPIYHTSQRNSTDSNNSASLQLRPSRSGFFQDLETRQCTRGIPQQPPYYNCSSSSPTASSFQLSRGGSVQCQSSEPTAKKPCLRPNVETQPVTPVRIGNRPYTSISTYPHCNMSASASMPSNSWQNPINNAHPMPRTPLSSARPHPPSTLQTPVVTNHLVQLMTAANKTPRKLSWETPSPKERRFPGPAGLLPHQGSNRGLDDILVSTPHTPNHGARAKLRSKEGTSSQQPLAEEFIKGPWATMKADCLLDENDPASFLRTYSVVMVLRKAALKQLPKNKVPQMAVSLKSLTPANGDASAVFRDPTGDIQGTVHHMLLEERESELKIGSVLLLQQVGVFSPSYRNHYLNVTPSNLVKIYPPIEEGGTSMVPVSLMPQEEVDVNGNQIQSPHHPSSSTTQPSASQPAAFHTLSSTVQPRFPQPASSCPSASTTQQRNAQPAVSHPSSRTAQATFLHAVSSFPESCTAQPVKPHSAASSPDWDMDDLDCLLCDLQEDSGH
ncbi:homologous recombination OB-fold protein isoform X2 [Pseudophryne corroboree]|uniref:homologous recombination OB-fold protein isoform X2 n=1 Tax=Pseudophryne corroboree TaxID=495146 RepID=UPI00308176CE